MGIITDYLRDQVDQIKGAYKEGGYPQAGGAILRAGIGGLPAIADATQDAVRTYGGPISDAGINAAKGAVNVGSQAVEGLTGTNLSQPAKASPSTPAPSPASPRSVSLVSTGATPSEPTINSAPTPPSTVSGPITAAASQSVKPYDVVSPRTATSPEVRSITNATLDRAYGDARPTETAAPAAANAATVDPRMDHSLSILHRELEAAIRPPKPSGDDFWKTPQGPDYSKVASIAGAIAHLQGAATNVDQAATHRLTATAQAPLYGAQAGEAGARATKEGAQALSFLADEARKQQQLALQTQLATETDPAKVRSLEKRLALLSGGKAVDRYQPVMVKDELGNPIYAGAFDQRSGEFKPHNATPSVPAGMKQVGTSGGKPVYEDKNGKRFIGN